MADISKLRFDGTEYNVKDASAPARPLGNGYSKTGTLPISSTDTISEAIGKLENTADTNQTNIWYALNKVGKNLLNFKAWSEVIPVNNGTKTVGDNTITLTATSDDCYTKYEPSYNPEDVRIKVNPGDVITLSWNYSAGSGQFTDRVYIFGYNNETDPPSSSVSALARTLTLRGHLEYTAPANTKFCTFRLGVARSGNTATYSNIMICDKAVYDQDPSFQPYGAPNYDLTRLEAEDRSNISSVEDMITDKEFDSTESYSIGDVVTYEHKLYKFKSAHSGAWSTSDVDQITVIAYVDDHSGGGGGAVSGVKGNAESTYRTGNVNLTCDNIGASPNDHSHGSIGRNGDISNDVTIGSSDKLLISDYSDSNRIKTSSVSFDGSTTTQALTKKGTWGTFLTSHQSLAGYLKTAYYTSNKTSGSLNDLSEGRVYCSSNCTNMPVSANMFVETMLDYNGSYKTQRAEVISGSYAGHIFSRYYNGSSWSSWIDLTLNTPITLATSGNISSASIDLSGILTGTYLFTVTNNESGTNRYGCSLYVLQKFDSGTVYIMKPVSEITNAKLSSYSFSGNTMSLSFDKSGYKTLRLICLYR